MSWQLCSCSPTLFPRTSRRLVEQHVPSAQAKTTFANDASLQATRLLVRFRTADRVRKGHSFRVRQVGLVGV